MTPTIDALPTFPDAAASPICPGCGCEFVPGGRGNGKSFCSDACRKAFHAIHRTQGFALAPLVKAWNKTRHAKPGTREAEICRFARREISKIARSLLDQDEAEDRDVVAYVGLLMDSGVLYEDRQTWAKKDKAA